MAENYALIKANPLQPAEDFQSLRKQGIKVIEKTGSDSWTDYNNSDPGITILEAVSYAITDLSYRTGFEIKDLLTPEKFTQEKWKETWQHLFYSARQILHNSPLTISDYRKMIIDIKGVRNAWIEPSKEYEVPLWIDYNDYRKQENRDCDCPDHEDYEWCLARLKLDPADPLQVAEDRGKRKLDIKKAKTSIEGDANIDDDEKKRRITELEEEEKKYLSRDILPSKIVELEGLYNVMVEYEEDVLESDERESIRLHIVEKLNAHRNLCEDFLSVNGVEYEEFGIEASMILQEYADADEVLAQIYFTIFKYFTPSVPFYTIDQMMAKQDEDGKKKYTVDQIFEGPGLRHGFIDIEELEATDLFRDIRLSDLINEIADIKIDGVKVIKAITYLHLRPVKYIEPIKSRYYFDLWIDHLRNERLIARINTRKSQVIFCKERTMIGYEKGVEYARMEKLFKDLKTQERKYKLQLQPEARDFEVPHGENMELEDYYPVTYSLPMCYGVSERAGLPVNADEKRKVQALQLEGYLLFFEQILFDYLVQLNHLGDLFSFDDKVKHTYFTGPVPELQDLEKLLINFQNSPNPKDVLNDFSHVLQNLAENKTTYYRRRNKFLNHLLARFQEDLTEYERITRSLDPVHADKRLIIDKINILKNGEYYSISSGRGRGYDYRDPQCWDSENISGAERRISRLLGFHHTYRRDLAPSYIHVEPAMEVDNKKRHRQKRNKKKEPLNVIKIHDPDNTETVLFKSRDVKEGCCTEELISQIIEHGRDKRYYKFREDINERTRRSSEPQGSFWFELYDSTNFDDDGVMLGRSRKFDNAEKRKEIYRRFLNTIDLIDDNEGLHLAEHILLRPRLDVVYDEVNDPVPVELLDVCLDECDLGRGLDEGTQRPHYRIKITRIHPKKCYAGEYPWILNYLKHKKDSPGINYPFLFQEVSLEPGVKPKEMKFLHYRQLSKRISDLREFGSEKSNYEIVRNEAEDPADVKYGFIIRHGKTGEVLAQSLYEYNKKDKKIVKDDVEIAILHLTHYFGFEMDFYCEEDPCDNNEDPYSFRATVVIPCWPKRFRDPIFRNLVEKTIQTEFPAHVALKIVWVGFLEMQRFERAYHDWVCELAATPYPEYEKVNPFVHVINTLTPCGCCKDECD